MYRCLYVCVLMPKIHYACTFSRNFPVDGEVANLLRTCYGETDVMDFGLNLANNSQVVTLCSMLPA